MSGQKRNIIEIDNDNENDLNLLANYDRHQRIEFENNRNNDNDNVNSAFKVLLESGGHSKDIGKKGGSKPHSWVWKFGDRQRHSSENNVWVFCCNQIKKDGDECKSQLKTKG